MSTNPTLADHFDGLAARLGDHPAVVEGDSSWSYDDLARRSTAIGELLASLGLARGRCAAIMLPNSGAFVASFFAVARLGGVVAPFNVRYREQELLYYLNDTAATFLVTTPELAAVARETLAGNSGAAPIIVAVERAGDACVVAPGRGDGPAPASGDGETPLLHQYTSGSTGDPKRIIRSDEKVQLELRALAEIFELGAGDRFLGAAPFSHVNGLVRTLLTSMFTGGTLYPVATFKRRAVLDLITREKLTYFGAVPYMFGILADTPVRGHVDLSSIRVAFSASAPLQPEDNERFREKYGFPVRQLYGSTETGTISVNLHDAPSLHSATVGTPLPGVAIEIRDDAGDPLPAGSEGEVTIASPFAISAYDGNPEANAEAFRDDYYYSGDLGHVDGDGFLTLTGRKKFLINRGGYKVNPAEVEEAIRSHDKVLEVVVLGAPSRFGDEVVRCVAVTSAPCTPEEITEHCKTRIADFKIPSVVEFRDELPKSAAGKILRSEL